MSSALMRGQFTRFSGLGGGAEFPDPFMDVASLSIPQNIRSALYWCEFIWNYHGTYRMAMERIISYFLTDVIIDGASEDERTKWEEYLRDDLDIIGEIQKALRNRMCYGNGFSSVVVPFRRFLSCPKCGYQAPLKEIFENKVFNFSWSMPDFIASCPVCKTRGKESYRGPWKVKDEKDETKIKIKHWNVHEIELLHDLYTEDVHYIWRIPEDYRRQIRQGNLFHLERVDMEVLKAVQHNQVFRFHPDAIYHMKEPTLSGMINRGWGIPRLLSNFRQIWYVQVLHRFNEAIALDYVIPFRIITPQPRQGAGGPSGGASDPLMMYDGGDFRNQALQMIRRRRRDPASIQVFPFPVNFQMFGADAKQLAPTDLIAQGYERLLNDCGTPVELYNGSLQLQTAPVALRLFEATHHPLVNDANKFLRWLTSEISRIRSWETVKTSLKRITIADNLEKQMMAAQMMMSQQLSGSTVLRDMGYDWRQEQKQISEESRFQSETQSRMQEEMEQQGFAQQIAKGQTGDPAQGGAPPGGGGAPPQGGGAPPGGDPSQGGQPQGPVTQYLAATGPNVQQTPQDMMAAADSIAQQLLGIPEGVKDSELRKLKQANPTMHALVKERMTQMRRETKTNAANGAAMAQQGGGAPPPQ